MVLNKIQDKKAFLRKVAKWTAVFVVLLIIGLYAFWQYFFEPVRFANFISQRISAQSGLDVQINRAYISFGGQILLDEVEVSVPGIEGEAGKLFETREIDVFFHWPSLLAGHVNEVRPSRDATIYLTDMSDRDQAVFNFQKITLPESDAEPDPNAEVMRLPLIDIESIKIVYGKMENGAYQTIVDPSFEGQLKKNKRVDDAYTFEFKRLIRKRETLRRDQIFGKSFKLTGDFDLAAESLKLKMVGLNFDDELYEMLPKPMRSQFGEDWRQYLPKNKVPDLQLVFNGLEDYRAEFLFNGNEWLVPPLAENAMEVNRETNEIIVPKQFTLVVFSGNVVSKPDYLEFNKIKGELRIPDDKGFKPWPFEFDGKFKGLDPEKMIFNVDVKTAWLELPKTREVMLALPEGLREFIERFNAQGEVKAEMRAWREEVGAQALYEGDIYGRNMDVRYKYVPYLMTEGEAHLNVNNQRIKVVKAKAVNPAGTKAQMTGELLPEIGGGYGGFEHPSVDLVIKAVDLKIDEQVYVAINPESRRIFDMMIHEPSKLMLLEEQHLSRDVRRNPLGFAPGGYINMVMKLAAPPGADSDLKIDTAIEFLSGGVIFEYFPYPTKIMSGKVAVVDGEITIKDLKMKGIYGGEMEVNGTVKLGDGDKIPDIPNIAIKMKDLPLSEVLYDSLPKRAADGLRQLKVEGDIQVAAEITADENKKTTAGIDIFFKELTATPAENVKLEKVKGQVYVNDYGLTIKQIEGQYMDGAFDIDGKLDWKDEKISGKLNSALSKFTFECELMRVLIDGAGADKKVKQILEQLSPEGLYDGKLKVALKDNAIDDWRFDLNPKKIGFKYQGQKLELEDLKGAVSITDERIDFRGISGKMKDGKFETTATVSLGEDPTLSASISAEAKALTPTLKKILPAGIQNIIEELKIETDDAVSLELPRLVYRPYAKDGKLFAARGELEVSKAKLQVGQKIKDFEGKLAFESDQPLGWNYPYMKVDITSKSFVFAERKITDFKASMASAKGRESSFRPHILEVSNMTGRVNGGDVQAKGLVDFNKNQYRLVLSVSNVNLKTLGEEGVKALTGKEAKDKEKDAQNNGAAGLISSGLLSGDLNLQGSLTDLSKRRGQGKILVRDANLYELPLTLGLLQLTNLSLPISSSFNRASVSYYFKDQRVVFDKLMFSAPGLQLIGKGWFDYKSRKLDLTFTSSDPNRLNLGALTRLIEGVKSEFLQIKVDGNVDKPNTRIMQFNTLTSAWQEVVKGATPKDK